ncbi:lipase-like PAD4 [Eutrema salsugineum]|uniref:lipase-like PAD4 n=1 Tax=Eutrema salsugineum TaxID=72664 RepID=UPI000CED50DE|nr:lipase-like PAD4 [Eutrema salsugineum]
MEECRFETSELQASFMMSTPLWSDSWSLCNAANSAGSIQVQHIAGIMYVALPAMEIIQLGDLVGLEVAGDGLFPALSTSLATDEPLPMVDAAILELFIPLLPLIQSQITRGLEMEGRKQIVLTGHSTGGALAALTALWLLSQPSPPSFRLLCITFGSPLLGNQTLSSSISRSRLAHKFCHVVSIHDLVPRRSSEQFWPFGTYLFCSDNGGVCLDNAASVRGMFLILNSTGTPNIEEHQRYGHYVSTLSHQFLVSRSFRGGNISDNSYQAGVALALESLGFSNDDPSGVSAKECIETSTRIGRAPILRSSELAIELGNVLPSRLEIQWYKESCDASPKQLGYYDNFKQYSNQREIRVNMSRAKLARFWDSVLEMVEKNELPFDFHLGVGRKWVYASQFYRLLAEPLDIAYFYKYKYSRAVGHYMQSGNRPKRYVMFDKWWEVSGEPYEETRARTQYASTTQDTCFWAKLEEVKECLDEMRSESSGNAQRRSSLWKKIVAFENYADTLVKMKEVSVDVLARNSSYSVWLENVREFKFKMGNGIEMVVDESDAMET